MAQMSGASERTAFVWRAASIKAREENDTSSPFFFEHRGVYDFFHCHAGRARLENIILHESTVRDQSLRGIESVVRGPTQEILYVQRPEFIGRSDAYVRQAEGMGDWEDDVAWHRLEHDANGNPIPQTKIEQLPAPLRLRVLEQDKRYIQRIETDVQVTGEITVQKPPARLPGEPAPRSMAELRRLAAMSVEQRRAELGASAVPAPKHGPVTATEAAPHQQLAVRPSPRQSQSLDQSGTGRGSPPEGGMKTV